MQIVYWPLVKPRVGCPTKDDRLRFPRRRQMRNWFVRAMGGTPHGRSVSTEDRLAFDAFVLEVDLVEPRAALDPQPLDRLAGEADDAVVDHAHVDHAVLRLDSDDDRVGGDGALDDERALGGAADGHERSMSE